MAQQQQFERILNFRDVASSVGQLLTPGLLYRSARLDGATPHDQDRLRRRYGIRTVIDLRSQTEHIEAQKKYSTATSPAAEVASARINLNGRGFERHLVWQLSYGQLIKLATYMALGWRVAGISILGRQVLQPRGLIGLATDTLQHSGPEIKQVFEVLAQHRSYPVLIHCTQGKDRTGLIVVLVLLLCGVSSDRIAQDYMLSERELESEYEERMQEIRSIGLDESFARCPREFVSSVATFIEQEYGDVRGYLGRIGISQAQMQVICKVLCGRPTRTAGEVE